ncbi:Glycoside hydrolase family 47 protein [Mycena sanguinolenta]|uniref:alpha-1,2-Mannosidase n=1 Tax=Mycena sanguinolenta TaxID=230812 RepID=A0A8H7CQD3_9AGAR|nr:Glycoside hydrolase family 47 protein [Mycena sanguinolenta]
MSGSKLRQRRKNLKDPKGPQYKEEEETPPEFDFDLGIYFKWPALPVLLALGVAYYLNPKIFHDAIQSYTGLSDVEMSRVLAGPEVPVDFSADLMKRDAIVRAFQHAWSAYERDAMGDDEYHPLTGEGTNLTAAGGIGYTVVDSIDTMLLMGLDQEYLRAREWVATKMSFERNATFNTFETTIRVLGGLLSAYHLSGNDSLYLEKATELADRIVPVFKTPSGLPLTNVNLALREGAVDPGWPDFVSSAEVATLQLELRYLSVLTGNSIYWEKGETVMRNLKSVLMPHGLASIFLNWQTGEFVLSAVRLGSRADSYYEYLLKQYLQTNSTEVFYRDMYTNAMDAVHKHLIKKECELKYERDQHGKTTWRLTPKQDHLVCFFGGSLLLGATTAGALVHPVSIPPKPEELSEAGQRDWKTGINLIKTCMDTHNTATGLAPEIVHFRIASDGMGHDSMFPDDWYIKGAHIRPGELPPYDSRYMLRPETIESLFLAFRLTGNEKYRNWAWQIFQAIEQHCRVESGGYATIINVDEVPSRKEDKMETFMLVRLFLPTASSPDASVLPLDKYVLNTEAHPLPIFDIPEDLML